VQQIIYTVQLYDASCTPSQHLQVLGDKMVHHFWMVSGHQLGNSRPWIVDKRGRCSPNPVAVILHVTPTVHDVIHDVVRAHDLAALEDVRRGAVQPEGVANDPDHELGHGVYLAQELNGWRLVWLPSLGVCLIPEAVHRIASRKNEILCKEPE
jgi:hypothetical protein